MPPKITKEQWLKRGNIVLNSIKNNKKVKGWTVCRVTDISNKTGFTTGMVTRIIQKLEELNVIKTKKSVGLFGSAHATGIKELK